MTAASFNKLSHADATERSVMFAKMQCEGRGTGLEKSDWIDTINRRSTALYGDASPRNFTKTITEDETGRLFFAALKRAGGSEIKPLVEKADDGPPVKLDQFAPCVALGEASAHDVSLSRAKVRKSTNPAMNLLRYCAENSPDKYPPRSHQRIAEISFSRGFQLLSKSGTIVSPRLFLAVQLVGNILKFFLDQVSKVFFHSPIQQ
jgi:hypothetical protein